MNLRPLADRKSEVDFFREMIAARVAARILLIEAAGGSGKTDLLTRFAHECPGEVCLVRFDLKAAEKGMADVFRAFRQALGADALPRFEKLLAELVALPNVTVSDNRVLGQMRIDVVFDADEATRKSRLMLLEEAFFDDLRVAYQRIALILDTFEQSPPELALWLGGAFLRAVSIIPHIVVVIAGRHVPERSVEQWEDWCERRLLATIDDVDEWHTYVQLVHLPFPRDAVKVIVLNSRGHPKTITETFAALAPQWGRA